MKQNHIVYNIVNDVFEGHLLTREEIVHLLQIPHHSLETGYVIGAADKLNRDASGGKAEVHAQIGLNLSPKMTERMRSSSWPPATIHSTNSSRSPGSYGQKSSRRRS